MKVSSEAAEKLEKLENIIRDAGSALIAFSGGVDSTFLLSVARDVLADRVAAATALSPTYTPSELEDARRFAKEMGVKHIEVESNELDIPGFSKNPLNRCYHCKKELFEILSGLAKDMDLNRVFDGSNFDDMSDYRPGRDAAKELGVMSPLMEAGLTKENIRELSRSRGLPTWDKPQMACLSSRFPFGTEITADRLKVVAKCEQFLRGKGFRDIRVRYHGEVARLELGADEMARAIESPLREEIAQFIKQAGFKFVTLDIQGFRSGSFNP